MNASLQWCVVGVVVVACGALLTERFSEQAQLRQDVEGLRAEQRRADKSRAHGVVEPRSDVLQAKGRPEEILQVRAEIAALSAQLREMKAAERNKPAAATVRNLAAPEWRNAGRTTPEAALETALWAAAAGELASLEALLVFDERAHAMAEELLRSLPQAAQTDCGDAKRLLALLAVKDVPASTLMAHVSELPSEAVGQPRWKVKLQDASGATRTARLNLRRDPGGWAIVVSERDVARLARSLRQ